MKQIEREKNQAEEIAKEFRLTSSEVDVFETRTSKASSELRQEQERLNVGERDKLLKSKVNGYFERKAELLKVLQEFDTLATELASNRSILSKVVNDVQDTISKDQDMVLLQQEQLNSVSSSANSSYKLNQRKQYKDNIDHLELLLIEAERSLKTIISTRQNTYHSMHLMVNGIESLVQQKINNNALLSEGANQYAERSDALEREIAISKNNLDSLIILRNDILDRCKLENQQIERLKSTRSDLLSEIVVIKNSNVNLDRKRSLQKDVIASMKTELDDGTTQLLDSSQLLLKSKSTLKISRVETEKAKHNQDVLKKAEELKTKVLFFISLITTSMLLKQFLHDL